MVRGNGLFEQLLAVFSAFGLGLGRFAYFAPLDKESGKVVSQLAPIRLQREDFPEEVFGLARSGARPDNWQGQGAQDRLEGREAPAACPGHKLLRQRAATSFCSAIGRNFRPSGDEMSKG